VIFQLTTAPWRPVPARSVRAGEAAVRRRMPLLVAGPVRPAARRGRQVRVDHRDHRRQFPPA